MKQIAHVVVHLSQLELEKSWTRDCRSMESSADADFAGSELSVP